MSKKYNTYVSAVKIKKQTHDKLKEYCKDKGLITQTLVDSIIEEYLNGK